MLQYTDNSLLLSVYYVTVYYDTLFKFSLYIYLYMAITYYTTYTACDCHILLFTLTTISDIAAISILVIFRHHHTLFLSTVIAVTYVVP